ncbi:FtsK/SpoIIIE family DNA translocase [Myroides sp. LJL110]
MNKENKSTSVKTKTASEKTKKPTEKTNQKYSTSLFKVRFLLQILIVLLGVALLISILSYLSTGFIDQSNLHALGDRELPVVNTLGKFGAYIGHLLVYQGFGISAILLAILLIHAGIYAIFGIQSKRIKNVIFWDVAAMVLLSIFFGFFWNSNPILAGSVGYEINAYLTDYLGTFGTFLVVLFFTITFVLYRFKPSGAKIKANLERFKLYVKNQLEKSKKQHKEFQDHIITSQPLDDLENQQVVDQQQTVEQSFTSNNTVQSTDNQIDLQTALEPDLQDKSEFDNSKSTPFINNQELLIKKTEKTDSDTVPVFESDSNNSNTKTPQSLPEDQSSKEEFVIEQTLEEQTLEENLAARLVQDFGEFDPTLELSNYKFPSIEILQEYGNSSITINQEELETNKNNIVDTLKNYKIDIAQIKATVGPTVTLYEIIPEAGVRISKIKNLEDDIALSLAALGIRIIAPIPGKGTIGIEVPNTKPSIVSMKSVIASPKFQNAEMELPVALGKTISNETFVVDLAKMPHLLMAGATGQGKSVGLNALLTSLLYKKHPAEVKFVLVDPKKVELTLFNKIERHYLAKLPDSEDAIITDNTKVINTLNSLCIEMDNRYTLLKDAMVRNIKEYNEKFKQRKLNPENGHRFLPYIVLVIDEFADLIMTAGKDVETPIARLAQLARAIGIHLIVATQRPSVNVITGIIKANFPARIAFRVTSKIDSRTILDGQGADQLIGRGDMLYTQGNDLVRVQCAFVDTPEVEKLTDYIGAQKAYPQAYLLPEYVGEDSSSSLDIDISERDALFKEAAEVIVTAQQGSASLLQRKLKLGYNRAGRIIDQLEAAGIVGPFEGSKARSVNIPDLASLEQFLNQSE